MRGALLVIVALAGIGCDITSPSENLSGYWTARSIGHSYVVGFMLMQNGDAITGKACAISDGVLLYKDAPVFGDYPDLQFTVGAAQTQPCCANMAGTQFIGKQDSTKDIVGTYGEVDLRFQRALTPLCN
jgi:hypothetical protein